MSDWDGTVVVATPRLLLRSFTQADLPRYADLNADPNVYVHLGGAALSREHSDELAEWAQGRFKEERLGLLAVERREDGAFLGMCGLHHQESYPDDVEVAWRFAHEYWGNGYATEAAQGWLRYGFEVLSLRRVISMTVPENVRSLAVMKRLGMTLDHEAKVVDDGLTFQGLVYAISAATWRSRQDAAPVE